MVLGLGWAELFVAGVALAHPLAPSRLREGGPLRVKTSRLREGEQLRTTTLVWNRKSGLAVDPGWRATFAAPRRER